MDFTSLKSPNFEYTIRTNTTGGSFKTPKAPPSDGPRFQSFSNRFVET